MTLQTKTLDDDESSLARREANASYHNAHRVVRKERLAVSGRKLKRPHTSKLNNYALITIASEQSDPSQIERRHGGGNKGDLFEN